MPAPGNIARGRTFDPERTRWHLMFVTDSTETVTRNGEQRTTVFDEAALRELAANRKREVSINARRGTVMQPKPVSPQHGIARRVYLGEDVPETLARRVGNDLDLHYHTGSADAPAGLYALVEWTRDEWAAIEDGSSMTLSPTTVPDAEMTDGYVLRGLSLQEIGTVDVPQLDSIGTTRDGLPWDAFGEDATDARPRDVADVRYRTPVWREAAPLSQVVMRSALAVEAVAGSGDEPPTPTEEDAMLTDEQKAEIAEMVGEMLTASESRIMEAIEARLGADTKSMDEVEIEVEPEMRSADPEPTFDELEDARIDTQLRAAVTSGTLLASRVPTARARMKAGEGIADLVGDYTATTLRSRAPQGAPVQAKAEEQPKVVMYSAVVAEAEATVPMQPGGRRNAIAVQDAINASVADLRGKGITIDMEA